MLPRTLVRRAGAAMARSAVPIASGVRGGVGAGTLTTSPVAAAAAPVTHAVRAASSITLGSDGKLRVPDEPIIPFIEGDGTGPDIWKSSVRVFDAAVAKAYNGKRKIAWHEVYAGEKAFRKFRDWLPAETLDAFRKYLVGIKGPLTTPVGGGIRSLNVALRQELDLYVCLRPVRYFKGVPSPVKKPQDVDMVIFRENTEDIYAGIEFEKGSADAKELYTWLQSKKLGKKVRFPETSAFGIKPVSSQGTERLVRAAIQYALDQKRRSVTLVHKGNIMKVRDGSDFAASARRKYNNIIGMLDVQFTEGGFRDWGYALATSKFRDAVVTERESWILDNLDRKAGLSAVDNAKLIEPGFDMMTEAQQKTIVTEVEGVLRSIGATHGGGKWKSKLMIKDSIADITLQQVLTRADSFDVIATLNLNGDYLSDALAAQVGGIGIAPGGNVNYATGHAIYEATHGTSPKYANLDKVNPGSVILSGEMMLRHLGWNEAADLIIKGMDGAISARTVTYDFHRMMDGAKLLKCSEFGSAVIAHM